MCRTTRDLACSLMADSKIQSRVGRRFESLALSELGAGCLVVAGGHERATFGEELCGARGVGFVVCTRGTDAHECGDRYGTARCDSVQSVQSAHPSLRVRGDLSAGLRSVA